MEKQDWQNNEIVKEIEDRKMATAEVIEQARNLEIDLKRLQNESELSKRETGEEGNKLLSLVGTGIVGWVDDF